ncbi:hypothetical protein FDECE_13231 [Fusarium decemcellulare]|nr:hypothetical protein FDECE_13231 [Fusarium decemcellulare]
MTSVNETSSITKESKDAKVWLVRGCSSGLGRCLVTAILARGDKVIATARQVSALKDIQNLDNVRVLSLDVTSDQAELNVKVQEAQSFFGRIDVLVNNAGYVVSGVWEELGHSSADEMTKEFQTNFFGAINMTRAVLPFMRAQRSGVIMFMGSIAGWHSTAAGGLILGEKSNTAKLNSQEGIADYAGVKDDHAQSLMASHDRQPGDPFRAAEKIVNIARVENLTASQANTLPLRIPLGVEAVAVMRQKCLETLALLEPWVQFSEDADFENAEQLPAFYSK